MEQLVVTEGQELQIWGMVRDESHIQIAFDCGDNGFLVLTLEQARELEKTVAGLLSAVGAPLPERKKPTCFKCGRLILGGYHKDRQDRPYHFAGGCEKSLAEGI
jgi:hypothetical protein